MSEQPDPRVTENIVVGDRPARNPGRKRLLLTNDDGVDSEGIRLLAEGLNRSHDVVVAAPSTDMSGSGTGIGRFDPDTGVDFRRVRMGEIDAYAVDGPPGLAVMAGALGAFGPRADLVVSGINAGINTGHSVIHSGTVGAVLTARTFGSHGLAVSLAPSEPWLWHSAVAAAEAAVSWLLAQEGPHLVLNVNVPAVPAEEIAGARWAGLDRFGYFRVAVADDRGHKLQFSVGGESMGEDDSSDTALVRRRFITVTSLSPIESASYEDRDAGWLWPPPADRPPRTNSRRAGV